MFSTVPRSLICCTNALNLNRALAYALTKCSALDHLIQNRDYHEVTGNVICPNQVRGIDHLRNPRLNKGLAFTLEERQALGLHGLLAAKFVTQEEQLEICRISIDRYTDNLNKYLYLVELQDQNEKLFFKLIAGNVEKYLPIVYTPTVGLACQKFGLIYRRPRGLFITINDKGQIFNILKNWPEPDVRAIVFTDGERILGLGDYGAYGMGIPVGKLSLYTGLAGIRPHQCLPITLDVGTDNEDLLTDPLYIGLRQKRTRGQEYDEFIDEFMEACVMRYGQNTLLQFEDFALGNAMRLLAKYRNKYCTFNDDIQGTASVAVAGLMAAVRITKRKLSENIYMFLGAGSAANGIAQLTCSAMLNEGLTEQQARDRVYMFDIDGLLTSRRESGVPDHAKAFVKDCEPEKEFEKAVAKIKPSCLIGCSTVGGAFTPNVLKQMAKNTERPIIFALSNPTSKAECTAQDAYDHTEGRCVFASGSPFPPVKHNGKEYLTGQGNNAYIFPGVALGVISTATHHIPENMFLTAARTLANFVSGEDLNKGRIYPCLSEIGEVSVSIAIAVAKIAYDEGTQLRRCRVAMARRASAMELSATVLVLLHLSMHVVDEGHAVNPSCSCIRFTSTYGKERGTFSSPDYPRPYPARLDCLLYTFLAAPHEIVELVFTDFDIYKEHLDCIRGDYLKVYWEVQGPGPPEAINERSAWARTLCGSRADAPSALYSPGPALVLEFHTSARLNNATGFLGTYSFIDKRLFDTDGVRVPGTECDFQFSRSGSRPMHGRLYSPRYPSIYPNNVRCSYHFHARPHERVKVVFEEISLQKGDISCLRRADIIKVFDGRDANSPTIAMLCNELTGYEVLSTGPALLLQFTANSASPGQGFAATFTFQPPPDSTAADSDRLLKLSFGKAFESLGPEVSATTSSCHQEFSSDTTKHGTLTSPQYPSPYPPNTHCHYEFFGRGKERVRLIFQDFYLYKSQDGALDCTNVDSLQAFVNVDGRLEKVDTFCGINLPKPVMSNGPKLMLEFRGTHSSRYTRGFKISYSFVENFGISSGRQLKEFPCAFVYNSSESRNGTFASPNSPGPYPRDTECTYFFHGAETEKVHLHFTNFDVEGVLPCEAVSASDYVEFSNYMIEDNRYGRYCGQMKEFHVESDRNFFKVTFRSNDRLDGTGFKAIYQFLEATDEYQSPPMQDSSNSLDSIGHYFNLLTFAVILLHH